MIMVAIHHYSEVTDNSLDALKKMVVLPPCLRAEGARSVTDARSKSIHWNLATFLSAVENSEH